MIIIFSMNGNPFIKNVLKLFYLNGRRKKSGFLR
jgi:hypothetical protein